jgi:hypothetical protein
VIVTGPTWEKPNPMKRLILISFAVAALAQTATASPLCIEQTIDGGTATERYVSGQSKGGSLPGTAYTKAAFCPVAAAAGTCTGESLSEPVAGLIYADRTVDLPDVDQFAPLDIKATAKAVAAELKAAIKEWRKPNPVAPIYQPWANGSCN